jgi:hypothetical protein
MSKLIAFVSTFIAAFLVIGMAAYFRYYAPAGTFLHSELDAASVVREIQGLNGLVQVRDGVREAVPVDGTLLLVQGQAAAAVKVDAVNQYSVESLHGHAVAIRLPAPRIVDITIDPQAMKSWDARRAAWTAWIPRTPNERQSALDASQDAVRKSAIRMGILEEARRQARQTVSAFLSAQGLTQIRFEEE